MSCWAAPCDLVLGRPPWPACCLRAPLSHLSHRPRPLQSGLPRPMTTAALAVAPNMGARLQVTARGGRSLGGGGGGNCETERFSCRLEWRIPLPLVLPWPPHPRHSCPHPRPLQPIHPLLPPTSAAAQSAVSFCRLEKVGDGRAVLRGEGAMLPGCCVDVVRLGLPFRPVPGHLPDSPLPSASAFIQAQVRARQRTPRFSCRQPMPPVIPAPAAAAAAVPSLCNMEKVCGRARVGPGGSRLGTLTVRRAGCQAV